MRRFYFLGPFVAVVILASLPLMVNAASPVFTTRASPKSGTIAPGQTLALTATVWSKRATAASLDIEIYGPDGVKVFEQAYDNEHFAANSTTSYQINWTVATTLAPGKYPIQMGLFSPDWSVGYGWNSSAGHVVVLGPVPNPTPSPSPTAPPTRPTFQTHVTAARPVIAPGETQDISASVTSAQAVSVAIDLELFDEHGVRLSEVFKDLEAFAAGQTKTYAMVWNAPGNAPAGPYTVQFNVFSPDWSTSYAWDYQPGLFSVKSLVVQSATTVPSPSASAAPPTATRTVSPTTPPTATATRTATTTTPPTATTTVARGTAVVVSVDTTAQQGPLKTRLSTNLVTPGLLEQIPGAQGLLAAWAPVLVRLHAGSDTGDPTALPAGSLHGDWNFGPLDQMAGAVRSYGGAPLLNVRYAPSWMWTCSDYFGTSAAAVGGLRDPSFNEFGDYMARLVGWYNKGGFTDESGVVHSSGHQDWVGYWEVWNEPDSSSETPCHPQAGGAALTPDQYVAMWNVVVPKMLAVDPSLKLVGPATSDPLPEYIQAVLQRTQRPPDVVSYHAYGGWTNTQTNQDMFDGLANAMAGADPAWGRPIWVSEINVNSAWGDDPHGRPAGSFGVAWGASAFRAMVLGGIDLAHQFEFISTPQFGMLDQLSGTSRLPYWRDLLLSQAFPVGSTIVRSTSSLSGIETLAARRPDGTVSVLVINRQLTGPTDMGNSGLPATVSVHLQGLTPRTVSLRQLDAATDAAHPPAITSLAPATDLHITSPGYGLAILEIAP